MLNFILFLLALYLLIWLLPRLWFFFKAIYAFKKGMKQGSFHWQGGKTSPRVEKDISDRAKIIEEEKDDA